MQQQQQQQQQQNDNDGWTVVTYAKKKTPTTAPTATNIPVLKTTTSKRNSSGNSGQDWKPVVFHKKAAPPTHQTVLRTGNYETVAKGVKGQRKDYDARHMAKLDNATEGFAVKRVDREFSKKIQMARQQLNLTQKELAQKLNLPHTVVTKYENGTAVLDGSTNQKFQRFLHI
jgi:DNA-binding transcriptional regulator YiaG